MSSTMLHRRSLEQTGASRLVLMDALTSSCCSEYIEEMFLAWRANSASVHKSWDVFFRKVTLSCCGQNDLRTFLAQGVYTPPAHIVADYSSSGATPPPTSTPTVAAPAALAPSAVQMMDAMRGEAL